MTTQEQAAALVRQALRDMDRPDLANQVSVHVQRGVLNGYTDIRRKYIALTIDEHVSHEEMVTVAYHEAAHLVADDERDLFIHMLVRGTDGQRWHSEKFHQTLAEGLQKRQERE